MPWENSEEEAEEEELQNLKDEVKGALKDRKRVVCNTEVRFGVYSRGNLESR